MRVLIVVTRGNAARHGALSDGAIYIGCGDYNVYAIGP